MTASDDRSWSRRAPSDDEGRGRDLPMSPGFSAEPLDYQTMQRSSEDGRFRPRRSASEREVGGEIADPDAPTPEYRPRDFSPEGRRAVPSWAPSTDGTPDEERLDYRTLTRAEVRAATERFSASDSGRSSGSDSPIPGASDSAGGPAGGGSDEPMSTPEQPLTRRQLRALREAQEAAQQGGSATDAPPPTPERPAARPWAPVFYGEPVQAETEADEDVATAEEAPPADEPTALDDDRSGEPESETPSWSGSAPATFAIPVVSGDREVADAAPDDSAPLDLVEPPEPEHRESPATEVPSVFDELFNPPPSEYPEESVAPAESSASQPESAEVPAVADQVPADAPSAASDPLAFLDAAPSAADRIDLPAPDTGRSAPVVGQPPVEPPGDRAPDVSDAEPIPVEAVDAPVESAEDVHPVVLDAEPLPAEDLPTVSPPQPTRDPISTPTGHWTTQAASDDAAHADIVAGRDVGGGHGVVTTNALVLPSIPSPELSGPLTTTGEIVITGSIDVPRSLSSTGAHPTQLDQSSLDHELDPGDQQIVSVDSQPVRAIKAVSTHTSTRGMMTNTKPRGNRGLTVLIFVTAGLAAVVVGVLIVGALNNAF